MRFIQALPFLGLAAASAVKDSYSQSTHVRRQVDIVKGVFTKVQSDTEALDTAVKSFSGDAGPLTSASNTLLADIKSGTTTVEGSSDVDITGATAIAQFVTGLQATVKTTIQDLIGAKSQLVAAGQGGVVYQSLVDQKSASQALADATTKKTPVALQSVASQLSSGIISAIQEGIDAYKGEQGKTAPSGGSAPSSGSSPSSGPAPSTGSSPSSGSAPSSGSSASGGSAPAGSAAPPKSAPSAAGSAPTPSATKAAPPASFTGAASAQVPAMGFALAAAGLAAIM